MVSLREGREVERGRARQPSDEHLEHRDSERERNTQNERISRIIVTLTHKTRSPTPPTKKSTSFLFSRARAIVSIARIRARIRDDAFASVVLDPAHYSRGAVSLFLSFFCGLSASSFSEFAVSRRARQRRRRRESNERERKKRKRRPEFGNKTDDSPSDARDSSARRTIFGSRALPLSLLR